MLVQIHANEKVIESSMGCMVKDECGQSCDGTLKLTVSEELTDIIN